MAGNTASKSRRSRAVCQSPAQGRGRVLEGGFEQHQERGPRREKQNVFLWGKTFVWKKKWHVRQTSVMSTKGLASCSLLIPARIRKSGEINRWDQTNLGLPYSNDYTEIFPKKSYTLLKTYGYTFICVRKTNTPLHKALKRKTAQFLFRPNKSSWVFLQP